MIKQISVSRLRAGMHLHRLGGAWSEHPFWRRSFRIGDAELSQILGTGITEVWIDTARGLDVDSGLPEDAENLPLAEPEVSYIELPAVADTDFDAPAAIEAEAPAVPEVAELDFVQANALCAQASQVLRKLHDDVRMGRAFDALQCADVVGDMVDHMMQDAPALLLIMRLKAHDEYAYLHAIATAALMVALARQLGFSRAQMCEVGIAGMLHDIGKLFVPAAILEKPTPLTSQEYLLVKSHVLRGHEALLQSGSASPTVLDVCLHHHERIDGSGYPEGLKGESISIFAKIAAICDVYDALTSERFHRARVDPSRALRQMAATQGHFDPLLFQTFVKTVGIYPVGVVVILQSRQVAVVVAQDERSLLRPTVKVFYSLALDEAVPAQVIRLASEQCDDKIIDVDGSPEMQMRALAELSAVAS